MIQEKEKFQLTNWEIVSVNPSDKIWNWKDLFCFWGVNIQTLIGFSLITSLYLVYNLNFFVVLFGSILASIFVYIFTNLIGKPSQKHGIPFPVFLRLSMGINGARYVALLRGFVGIFMFGVQTYFLSKSVGYLIRILYFSIDNTILDIDIFLIFFINMNIIDWLSLIISLWIQYYLFSKGQKFLKSFINFSAYFVYFGLVLFLIIIISENYSFVAEALKNIIQFENLTNKENLIPLLSVSGTLFAYFSIVIVNFGDFSRYVSSEKELKKGNLSLLLNLLFFSFFAVLIVLGADIIFNKKMVPMDRILTNPTDIIGKFDNTYLTVVGLLFILVASSSTNLIANYIPSQNSIINFFPKTLNLKSSGITIVSLSLIFAVFWEPLLSQIGILTTIHTISSFFGPIFGIVIVDYYFIKNKEVINKDIFSSKVGSAYYFSNGWNIKAIYSLLLGFIFASATIWNIELNFLQTFSWIIGAFFSSITYYLLSSE